MSEISISREEAIKWLEKSVPICVCTSSEFGEFIQGVDQAISDMEKLEKIEDIMNDFKCADNKAMAYYEIEQIVKN